MFNTLLQLTDTPEEWEKDFWDIRILNEQYGQEEIAEMNQKNLERLQDIYKTIKDGNIIFGQIDREKRKQGVTNG